MRLCGGPKKGWVGRRYVELFEAGGRREVNKKGVERKVVTTATRSIAARSRSSR